MAKGEVFVPTVFFVLLLVVAVGGVHVEEREEAEADRITELPGQPKVSFAQFSGYVTVNAASGRALFYWLTEAVHAPESKPLVIWLNGGPGCSSVAYGASEEIGPFRLHKKGSGLYLNKYSWNLAANLLFLETPAGVGFSYTNTSSDLLNTGDERTAKESLIFLIRWLDRFPRYKHKEIFLTGESYAGHYVPQLSKKILSYNAKAKHPINLKGFMVGNAVTDTYYDNLGTVTYWWSHAMISDRTYKKLLGTCNFRNQKQSNECDLLYSYAMDQEFGDIDQYNIYAPPCNNSDDTGATRRTMRSPLHHRKMFFRQISGYDPCTEKYAEIYYNRPDVQRALHANTTKIPYRWTACRISISYGMGINAGFLPTWKQKSEERGVLSLHKQAFFETLNRNWNDTAVSVLPIYKELISAGLRIWVFSGDVDSVVPVTATRFSLAQLRLRTKILWYPWYVKKQVGGWTEVYEGLTFATVRGAGHEVPLVKPREALQLFRSFLRGEPLPES